MYGCMDVWMYVCMYVCMYVMYLFMYVGGCQNFGPFLVSSYNTAPSI